MTTLSRRHVIGGVAAAMAQPLGLVSTPASAQDQRDIEFSANSYIRAIAHLEGNDAFTWFTGTQYLQRSAAPIIPLVGFDTIVRRQVQVADHGKPEIIFSEANVFHDLGTGEVSEQVLNPITGELLHPLHYREGPNPLPVNLQNLGYSDPNSSAKARPGRSLTWKRHGQWFQLVRRSIIDRPHPMDKAIWRREAADRFQAMTLHRYRLNRSEFQDSSIPRVGALYDMTVLSSWMPWMLMGETPGHLLWIASGEKVVDVNAIPKLVRDRVEAKFPGIFAERLPWEGPMSFMRWHELNREPVR